MIEIITQLKNQRAFRNGVSHGRLNPKKGKLISNETNHHT